MIELGLFSGQDYQHTLRREWPTFDLVRSPREKKLPVVLSAAEVRRILGCLYHPRYRACLTTIYSCGLRLQEGVHLQVRDIDSDRMVVRVRKGKGAKDRYVLLPMPTLKMLRQHWSTHRHPRWLFPASVRMNLPPSAAIRPIHVSSVQEVRDYGFLASGCRPQLAALRQQLGCLAAERPLDSDVNGGDGQGTDRPGEQGPRGRCPP